MPVPTGGRTRRANSDDEAGTHADEPASMSLTEEEDFSRPQPLGKAQAPNIRNLLSDFRQQADLISSSIQLLIETAEQTAEAHSNFPEYEPLQQMDRDLRELIDLQVEKVARQKALTEMMQDLDAGQLVVCHPFYALPR